ncbi:MAG: amidase family protein [Candidatus Nanoarchaeia archaeon]
MKAVDFVKDAKSGRINLDKFYTDLFKDLRAIDSKYDCFITLCEEEAFKQLEGLPKGCLYGVPVSVKDALCTKGIRTTGGSRMLADYKPTFDATVIQRIKAEGGVIIGKTCMDEFGLGGFSTNCAFKVPKNPVDINRVAGGSSGGAAVVTRALDTCHIAIAESTGGSITDPAAFCGVHGLTPTYGRVSRYGLLDYASSLDKIGMMSRHLDDIALMMNVIAGQDSYDQTSRPEIVPDYIKRDPVKGMTIGVPAEYFGEGIDEGVSDLVWKSIKKLESKGVTIKKVNLKMTKHALPAYYVAVMSEVSTNLSKLCGMRYGLELPLDKMGFNEYFSKVRALGFGPEAKRRIILGTYARMSGYRSQYYLQAMKVRTLIINDFKQALKGVDALASPSMPVVAPRFDEVSKLTPLENYKMDVLTCAPNLAGVPHLSTPCGVVNNLPVGLQLIGDYLNEKKILDLGVALQ